MTPEPSLRPVSGSPRAIEGLLRRWLDEPAAAGITVSTSGSTGVAKQVVLSASAVLASATASTARIGGPGQWVLALPAHYVAGLQVITRSILAGTSPVVLEAGHDFSAATAQLSGDRRYLAVVPTLLHRWLQSDAAALASYDAILLGGGPARPELLAAARERGVEVVTTYGMTETCGGCVYDGVPLDGVAVALGAAGDVRISGPVLFEEYAGRPDLTAEVLHDGWLHTPDLGRLDHDGRLVVVGRSDEVVVSGGVNVALPAVEARIATMPGVNQVAVTSRPDEEWGVRVVAFVVGASPPSLAAVRDFVAEVHPRSWAPRELVVVGALPMLESGKVDRQHLSSVRHPPRLTITPGRRTEAFRLAMNVRFRGIEHREGMLIFGPAGVGEFSPFWDYDIQESAAWLAAALEAADTGFPEPIRAQVPVNCTVPAVGPEQARAIVTAPHGCRTAKVKVAEAGQTLADDLARVAAVREAIGPRGRVRIDANGGWSVEEAVAAITLLAEFDLEYVEQPAASVEELAAVRRRVDVPIAADESIRRAEDPRLVKRLGAADIAVLKVQPLGGVQACLRLAQDIDMPVVVSSALESSVGITAGVALAAALPELPYACGLATAAMFTQDLIREPWVPVDGMLDVRRTDPDPDLLAAARPAEAAVSRWVQRFTDCTRVLDARR